MNIPLLEKLEKVMELRAELRMDALCDAIVAEYGSALDVGTVVGHLFGAREQYTIASDNLQQQVMEKLEKIRMDMCVKPAPAPSRPFKTSNARISKLKVHVEFELADGLEAAVRRVKSRKCCYNDVLTAGNAAEISAIRLSLSNVARQDMHLCLGSLTAAKVCAGCGTLCFGELFPMVQRPGVLCLACVMAVGIEQGGPSRKYKRVLARLAFDVDIYPPAQHAYSRMQTRSMKHAKRLRMQTRSMRRAQADE